MTINFKEEIKKDMAQSGFNVHDHLKSHTVPELRKICDADRSNFVMGLINVTGDMNCGSIIRTACLFGAQKIIIFGRKKFDRRGLVGTQNYIDFDFVPCLNDDLSIDETPIIEKFVKDRLQPILIEQNGMMLGHFNWGDIIVSTPCFLVGNENRGIPDNVINGLMGEINSAFVVSIPQKGVIRSMNVSCAASVVTFDYMKETNQF